ncbi:hypothetical protein QFC21_004314 [Naganishia friedmannii]|uniref:Uncharacterized protein n=1 Tax=Naganishia friedmannii TaxID=89922 RepID=A0ACC2VJ85_9TREE|nr:hypothetical protein QFC21_004314 [Naganishia friedmannii]
MSLHNAFRPTLLLRTRLPPTTHALRTINSCNLSTSALLQAVRPDSTFFNPNVRGSSRSFVNPLQQAHAQALLLILPSSFYLLGSLYPPSTLTLLFPRAAAPPLRPDSEEGRKYTQRLEEELQGLSIVKELRGLTVKTDGSDGEWYETRPMAKSLHPHSLTSSVLRGPSMFAVPPLAFIKSNESAGIIVVHVGRSLCGHDGIVHGGLLATVLDECLGRNALLNIPSKIGVTATLNVQYKKPTKADQFIVVRTELDAVAGRKVNVSGSIESLDGEILATAQALFVEPKYAEYLKNSGVAAALGERPRPRILDMDDTKEERVRH